MLWLLAIVVSMAAGPSQAAPVLRVGVADGSQPCSYRQRGSWSGMAVDLWQQVADQEQIPYVLVPAAHQNASARTASACPFRNRAWG